MRGIVLAGGTGSRLGDVTKVVNKHILPVGGRPMIYWPIKVLRDNGVDDITIVSTPRGVGQLAELLGEECTYRVQEKPGGIAQAIACAGRQRMHKSWLVVLGDNIFLPSPSVLPLPTAVGVRVFLKGVTGDRIKEFGVPVFGGNEIVRIDEKPDRPTCNLAVTGLYLFSPDVIDRARSVVASGRGETEVTDLLNSYADQRCLYHNIVGEFWGDAGTVRGLQECSRAASDLPWSVIQ